MKYRIVEVYKDRFHIQRAGLLFWHTIGNPPLTFLTAEAAETECYQQKLHAVENMLKRKARRRVVKVVD